MELFFRKLSLAVIIVSMMFIIGSCTEGPCVVGTAVDENMQGVMEEVLKLQLNSDDGNLEGASAVVMDINDNNVKAVANIKLDSGGRAVSLHNYVFNEQIEPGQLFHAAVLASLLDDNCVNMDTQVDAGNGKWSVYGHTYTDAVPLGKVTLGDAFLKSSNVAFAKLCKEYYGCSPKKFVDNVKGYFSAQYMDADVPAPIFADPSSAEWHDSRLTSMAAGYNVMVTPVQLATFYNAIANGGGAFLPKNAVNEIMGIFVCDSVKILAGKAVSRIMISPSIGYEQNGLRRYQSSVCGYFPVDNPKYTLLVTVFGRVEPGTDIPDSCASIIFDDMVNTILK